MESEQLLTHWSLQPPSKLSSDLRRTEEEIVLSVTTIETTARLTRQRDPYVKPTPDLLVDFRYLFTSNKRVVVVVILIIGKRVSISLPTKNFFTFNDRETTWDLGEERPTNERVIKWSLTLVVGYNMVPYQWPIIFLKACHVSFKGCHNLGEIISLRFEYNSKLISSLLSLKMSSKVWSGLA